jgi:predicted Zn-dependent protease
MSDDLRASGPAFQARAWFGVLLALMVASPVFAYKLQGNARWPDGTVRFELQLGTPPQPLLDGSVTWDEVALAAIDEWNRRMGRLQIVGVAGSNAPIAQGNRRNNVFFSDRAFNRDFGERTLAVAYTSWSGTRRVESNIVFNNREQWNSYRGNVRASGGRSLTDLRRVALHEFGHALGLDHPDEDGQTVSAIMNSRAGNLDRLATDDINGIQVLYGAPASLRDPLPPPGGTTAGALTNLSVRSRSGSGSETLIVGFVTQGGSRSVLLRGVGPGLAQFQVPEPLADPRLTLFRSAGAGANTQVATNDNWGGSAALTTAFSSAGAFSLAGNSRDAALQSNLAPAAYSAHLTAAEGNRSGVALVEVYALGGVGEPGQLVNLSARARVGRDADMLIAGFNIGGDRPVRLLIRGVGPSLSELGVTGVLADPQLRVLRGTTEVAANTRWTSQASQISSTSQRVGAFALQPGSLDAALVVELEPGLYTVQLSGAGNSTGVALIEIYLAP